MAPWVENCKIARMACLLVPVFCDNAWWHSAIQDAVMIDFFKGRVQFKPHGVEASSNNGRHCLIWFSRSVEYNWVVSLPADEGTMRIRSRSAKTGEIIK